MFELNRDKVRVFNVVLFVSLLIFSFIFCNRQKTDKDMILELVDAVGDYAENKYIASILDLLTEDFSDMEKRSKTEMETLLSLYFEQYFGIAINILGTKFNNLTSFEAEIETEVSLSSGQAKMLRKWITFSGQTYRFLIRLKKMNQVWKVYQAEWKPVYLEELFPESLKILKELFPKL